MNQLSPEAYAVIEGRHSDPFHYLGRHIENKRPVVRVFMPDAAAVSVIDDRGSKIDLDRVHDAGLFAGYPENNSERYRLRAQFGQTTVEMEDAYRFPPVLSEFDLHLLSEGRHLRLYDKLGAHPTVMDGVDGVAFATFAPGAQRVDPQQHPGSRSSEEAPKNLNNPQRFPTGSGFLAGDSAARSPSSASDSNSRVGPR
jgi:1,4-alpha-glucan branching enzyme